MNSSQDPLLQPLKIKHLHLRNRIMSTSHHCGLEDADGMPGEVYQRYHQEKARGGLALTMFGGSAFVAADSIWPVTQVNMSSNAIVPYLESFSQRVHDAGAAIMIQLTHLGRRAETNTQNWLPAIGPSPLRETLHRAFPRAMDKDDINRVVKAFGQAALRARQGGLDGLETMVGGHLIGQFLSPSTNLRSDEFGGSLQNRCRFGLLVHEEIRRQVGNEYIVGMRFPIDEAMSEGMDFDDCVEAANIFQESGLIDFFNANYGRLDTMISMVTDCMPNMASPIAPWLEVAGKFKHAVNLPVFHAARITDLATARYAIREGLLDMVAMTRAHIADPQIVNKIQSGEEARIRPCLGITHCMGEARPTCVHNAASGREADWPQLIQKSANLGRKAVVVGGGPAGLEAARILAERGHRVSLLEATDQPGGQLRMASAASWRKDIVGIIDWRLQELARLNVDISYNILAEAEDVLALRPDIVIIATGGLPDLDWIKGSQHCSSVWDVLSGSIKPAPQTIVYDGTGRHPALTVTEFCANAGSKVDLVMLDAQPAAELDYGEAVTWRRQLATLKIRPLFEYRLQEVTKQAKQLSACFVNDLTGELITMQTDQLIVEHGTIPFDDIYHTLREKSCNNGITDIPALLNGKPQPGNGEGFTLHRIGDALSSRNVAAAMYDALRLCSVM
ncbi:MAG: FAD-dependent oxidoreductase [Gammaproteobacteria bacterium]|nr:FAD-dependent oxidoreductase [Gammaproteobacteria bacterium]